MTLIFIDRRGSLFTEMSEGIGRKYGKILAFFEPGKFN